MASILEVVGILFLLIMYIMLAVAPDSTKCSLIATILAILGGILVILGIALEQKQPYIYYIISEETFTSDKEEIRKIYFTNKSGKREVIYLDDNQYKEWVKDGRIALTHSDYNDMAYDCFDE